MATTPAQKTTAAGPGLKRSLSVWQAVGLSLALMAPSMAANINPQGAARGAGGRCRWRSSSRRSACCSSPTRSSGCASTTSTPGRSTRSSARRSGRGPGVVAGWGLAGTYVFYAVTTAARGGHLRRAAARLARRLEEPAGLGADAVRRRRARARAAARRAAGPRRHQRAADRRGVHGHADPHRHRGGARQAAVGTPLRAGRRSPGRVFSPTPGTSTSGAVPRRGVRLPVVRRVRGVGHARRGGAQPARDIPRAILGVAIFGGIYFVVVTAVEMMGFGTVAPRGSPRSRRRRRCSATSAPSYVGSWVGDVITAGTTVSRVRLLPGLHGRRGAAVLRDVARLLRRARRRRGARPVGHARPTRPAW